jgi:predicted dehydrogenase/threonine dehydrogenase-like Zn-dependent dehydrogenase
MKQLTQQLKSGKMEIMEVPFPTLGRGEVLVRNHYSVISSGTEGKTVLDARKGYISKARSRQKEVKQVVEMVKSNGFISTYKFVMNKLDAPSALGYSCSGEIIGIGENVTEFKVGDYVSCGGNSAVHADVVSVPTKLAVKIPKEVDLKHAAFTTLGAIALQGIRQSELKVGENCLIIGMGLIGQLTAELLNASGVKAICVDVSQEQIDLAKKNGFTSSFHRNQAGIEEIILSFSNGHGVDSVIITAGSSSLDPIEFAGEMARKKGKIVIVGAVPTGFDRGNFYKKELEIKMSMSYGPGRGDANYEVKGNDYPIAYARWTENRNMQAFVSLISEKKINISKLISHIFPLENAEDAYDLILSKNEAYNGILLSYEDTVIPQSKLVLSQIHPSNSLPNIGLIGAGNFAQGTLLPHLNGKCNLIGLVTSKGNISKFLAEKYNFRYATNDEDELFNDDAIDTIFITTRHDTHAKYVIKAIHSQKNVFVEKPLALNPTELLEIKNAYEKAIEEGKAKHLIVGFNRRFSPAVERTKSIFTDNQVKAIQIRVNAGNLPVEHWVNDPEIGGGRIIGEACHFIDLAQFLAGSFIKSVSSEAMKSPSGIVNTIVVQLSFENGSIASISYFSNGNKLLNKEFIEVFSGGTIVQIDDFKIAKNY